MLVKQKKIINYFKITSIITALIAATNLIYEKINKPSYKYSNTIVPMSIIAFHIQCILFLYLFYKNQLDNEPNKQFIKKILILVTVCGPVNVLTALAIGGIIFKFKACVKVYSVALFIWLLFVTYLFCFYEKKKIYLSEHAD